MDTTATGITFDADGVCSYCTAFAVILARARAAAPERQRRLGEFIDQVKRDGRGKDYDCIVGVSGGVDSSWVLYLAVKHGLRPLAVHLDNGWNSELASHNITNLVNSLKVDLYTHVIDWNENRDLQRSFFKAHVVDIEMLMDNAMLALNYRQAAKYGLKAILSGANTTTEGLAMPAGWSHYKYDARNIRNIQRRFGTLPIKTHILISTLGRAWYESVHGIKWLSFLDYFDYDKHEALAVLQNEASYKPYPYKHYESVFTRFYQAYILPRKFGYDKRRVHLSALVMSGQLTRAEALRMLAGPTYPDPRQEEQDRIFVTKKLGYSADEMEEYLRAPAIPHATYGTELPLHSALLTIYRMIGGARA